MKTCTQALWSIFSLSLFAVAILLPSVLLREGVSAQVQSVTINLTEVDVPGITGTATLSASGEGTRVEMELSGPGVTGDHPTHIHTGTCDDFDPNPLYPLTTVILNPVDQMGGSTTVVDDASLDELLDEDFVILVHQSADELTTYLVCGEIKETSSMPATGVGSTVRSGATLWLLALVTTAALLLTAALGLRCRDAGAGR